MVINEGFANRIIKMRGQAGKAWLESIAATIKFCESHWKIKLSQPFNLNFNFVTASTDGRFIVKICLPGPDFQSELKTLQHYRGHGLCNLIDAVEERHILLLEVLHPGYNITTLGEDAAITAACSIVKTMRDSKLKMQNVFPSISDWALDITKLRSHLDIDGGPFNNDVLDRLELTLSELIMTQKGVYLLHGDLHHENILAHGNRWKAIDPKGVVGEAEFEIIPFVLNNVLSESLEALTDFRVKEFSRILDLNLSRIYGWGLVRSVLAVWWNIEDNLGVPELDLKFIDFFDKKVKLYTT